jgi:cytochrome b subunit of formate dehydrogenase
MMPRDRRPLTGRRVLVWLLLFFGVVAMVNGVMIWLALLSNAEISRHVSTMKSVHPLPAVVMREVSSEQPPWKT